MSHTTRGQETSTIRSYTAEFDKVNNIVIKPSHWAPGYTEAHAKTPEEAVVALDKKIDREWLALGYKRDALTNYIITEDQKKTEA